MINARRLTGPGLGRAQAAVAAICAALRDSEAENLHEELGSRLYAALGEVHLDDWPELFGRGGVAGPSFLGTAYSAARLRAKDAAEMAYVSAGTAALSRRMREAREHHRL